MREREPRCAAVHRVAKSQTEQQRGKNQSLRFNQMHVAAFDLNKSCLGLPGGSAVKNTPAKQKT